MLGISNKARLKPEHRFRDLYRILNEENLGFPKGNNQGAEKAKGKYLLLLNNDTIVTEGWLEKLLVHIHYDSKLAAVGPYANHS